MIPRSPLPALGYGCLLILLSWANAPAQDQSGDANAPANAPTTTDTQAPQSTTTAPSAQTPAAPAEPAPSDSTPNNSRAQVPDTTQSPLNPQPTTIPLFPAQLGNPISPYNSSSVSPQSPQLTQPTLYVTGVRDVSQISTNGALTQAFSQQETQGADIYGDESVMNYEHPPIERIRIGPVDLKAAAVTSVVADDNYRGGGAQGNTKRGDISFALTPALNVVYGDHDGQKGFASLVYAPTLTRLYHESANDTDDQNVAFNAIYPFQRLTLSAAQTYTETSGVNTDTNLRTTQNSSFTSIGANYEVDEKISVASQVQYVDTTFSGQNGQQGGNNNGNEGGIGGTTTSINNSMTYRLSEKLTLGPNINLGWDRPNGEQKSTYQQGLLAVNYTPTTKIGLYTQAGAEYRQYDQGGGDKFNPVFTLGVGYNPFDSTSLSLNGSQTVHTSTAPIGQPTNGQTVVTTSVGVSATQRIVQRIFVSFSFNYDHNDGSQNGGGGAGVGGANSTSQDTLIYRPYVTFAPTAWSSVSLYYQYLSNVSNIQGESYNDNQVGLSVSAQF